MDNVFICIFSSVLCHSEREREREGGREWEVVEGVGGWMCEGDWGELVWWGKEGTDVGEGRRGVRQLIPTFAHVFGLSLTTA